MITMPTHVCHRVLTEGAALIKGGIGLITYYYGKFRKSTSPLYTISYLQSEGTHTIIVSKEH